VKFGGLVEIYIIFETVKAHFDIKTAFT